MKRISLGLILFFACGALAKPVVVLVPGFFNSLAPGSEKGPYFSHTILTTLQNRAKVYVVDNLSPVGSVADNGNRLATFLTSVAHDNPGAPISLITHSAGGYYAFYALSHHSEFPVKAVVTLATPYRGVEWLTDLTLLHPELEAIADYLSLGSLREFEAANALKLAESFRLPEGLRVVAVAGTQDPCGGLDCSQAEKLSWPFAITQKIMSEASDGIVNRDSALATNVHLLRLSGRAVDIERWTDMNIGLEHWEMVLDANLGHLLGVVNTDYVDRRQKEFYAQILDRLGL